MISQDSRLKIRRFDKWIQAVEKGRISFSEKEAEFLPSLTNEVQQYLSATIPAFVNQEALTKDQDILLVGTLCNAGTYLLGKYYSKELLQRLPLWFVSEAQRFASVGFQYPSAELIQNFDISAFYSVGEGGLLRTLYQLGKDSHTGFRIDSSAVLLEQITIEFCEFFDMHPFQLLSCGCTLIVTPHGNQLLRYLKRETNLPCAIIGTTTSSKDKVLSRGDSISRINPPEPDELLRFMRDYPYIN